MIRTIIIDDDVLARNQISALVDWPALGYELIGEAMDGIEGIKLIEAHNPDLVLTDVAMPRMNGVELVKKMASSDRLTSFVMISSYDEYDYLRQAFKYGALDYLLKDDLSSKFLENFLTELAPKIRVEMTAAPTKMMSQDQVINDYLLGIVVSHEKVEKALKEFQLDVNRDELILVAINILYSDIHMRLNKAFDMMVMMRSIMSLADQVLGEKEPHVKLWISPGKMVLIGKPSLIENIDNLDKLLECLHRFLDVSVVYTSAFFSSVEGLRLAHERTHQELQHTNPEESPKEEILIECYSYLRDLDSALNQRNRLDMHLILRKLQDEILRKKVSLWSMQPILNELLGSLERCCFHHGLSLHNQFNCDRLVEDISHCQSVEQLFCLYESVVDKLLDKLKNKLVRSHSAIVNQALHYIKEHYAQDISLGRVAHAVGVVPTYLSSQISMETGMTFTEHLNKQRIQAADEILKKDDLPIKAVYDRVGFKSYNYFFKVYKDVYGESPLQRHRSISDI